MTATRHATTRVLATAGGGKDSVFDDRELLARLGRFVRVVRVSRGVTQRELAQRVGKSQNLVWLVESGKKDPGIVLLKNIADALNMPLDYFLVPIVKPRSTSSQEQAALFRQGRDLMMSLVEGLAAEVAKPVERKAAKKSRRTP